MGRSLRGGGLEAVELGPEDWRAMVGPAGDDGREEWAGRRGTGVLPQAPARSAAGSAPGHKGDRARRASSVCGPGAYLNQESLQYIECVDWTFEFCKWHLNYGYLCICEQCTKNFTVQCTLDN